MIAFEEAVTVVSQQWPDYDIAPYGYETNADWLLLPRPVTTGGRVAAVNKDNGAVRWINETSDAYDQSRPVGAHPSRNLPG